MCIVHYLYPILINVDDNVKSELHRTSTSEALITLYLTFWRSFHKTTTFGLTSNTRPKSSTHSPNPLTNARTNSHLHLRACRLLPSQSRRLARRWQLAGSSIPTSSPPPAPLPWCQRWLVHPAASSTPSAILYRAPPQRV